MNKRQAYTLGFLFADGALYPKNGSIRIEIVKPDMDELKNVFDSFLDWNIYERTRKRNGNMCQTQTSIYKGNMKLCADLVDQGYYNPRNGEEVLKYIPEHLHHMWFRGYFDGDGCAYFNPKQYLRQLSVSGPKDMDWSFFLNQFPYFKQSHTHGSGGILRISNLANINTFMSYIYPKGWDKIGLKRKWNKYQQMLPSHPS